MDTHLCMSILGKKRLAILISWLAHGAKYHELTALYDVSAPSVSNIIHSGIGYLVQHFVPGQIQLPSSPGELQATMHGFETLCKLPFVCGALDGTFMGLVKPADQGNAYYCYKKYYAITILALVDSTGRFIYVDVVTGRSRYLPY